MVSMSIIYGEYSILYNVGLGDPTYFYVHMIFALNGLMASSISLLGTYIRYLSLSHTCANNIVYYNSGSLWGGIISLSIFFYNHGQVRRHR